MRLLAITLGSKVDFRLEQVLSFYPGYRVRCMPTVMPLGTNEECNQKHLLVSVTLICNR